MEISVNISGETYDVAFGNYNYSGNNSDLASIYSPQMRDLSYTPVLSLLGEYRVKNYLSLGFEAAYWFIGYENYDPFTEEIIGEYSRHSISLMPAVKFNYCLRKYFSLHSGVSAGATFRFGKDGSDRIMGVRPAFQIIPIGMRIGSDLYATIDYYMGNVAFGARFGIGYRF